MRAASLDDAVLFYPRLSALRLPSFLREEIFGNASWLGFWWREQSSGANGIARTKERVIAALDLACIAPSSASRIARCRQWHEKCTLIQRIERADNGSEKCLTGRGKFVCSDCHKSWES